uniref:Concanavalin A-like lectin/glucanase, subgroup n=1 Tax=Tanacetum cinerariifolium TaxID=118510 RepID=A0A6L2N4G4_TANCI|nr:concanavalin A-like lectin/glucanase, subgroup [Tanacetum cinerariifolium]
MLKMVVALKIWLLVSMFIFSLQTHGLVISQNLACDSDDLHGLTGFMNGLDLKSPIYEWWSANASSLSSSNCCNWVGITCDSSSGRIVRLELPNKILYGVILDFLFRLPRLRELTLDDNEFTALFGVSNITSGLVRLDFSTNRILENLLDFFYCFPNLKYFSVHSNNLTGELPSNGDLQFKALKALVITNCRLRGGILSWLKDLSGNYFIGQIWPEFGSLKKLQVLDLGYNNLSGKIPTSLSDLSPPPSACDKDEYFLIICMLVIIGFGSGFLLTVTPLLVVPGIKGTIPVTFQPPQQPQSAALVLPSDPISDQIHRSTPHHLAAVGRRRQKPKKRNITMAMISAFTIVNKTAHNSQATFRHFQGTTSRDLWLSLEKAYASHSTSREYTLKTQILRIEMHGDETPEAYLNRAQEYADALAAIGEPVKDKDLVMLAVLELTAQLSALGFQVSPIAASGLQPFYGVRPSNNNRNNIDPKP